MSTPPTLSPASHPARQEPTPGPWVADRLNIRTQGTEERPRGQKIAHVQGRDFAETPADFANAHLIAAAPELLSIARRVWLALDRVRTIDARWLGPQLRKLHEELGAVIRQAQGGQL